MTRRRLAVHEAGHAIVAAFKGDTVLAIRIPEDYEMPAATWVRNRGINVMENRLAHTMAGRIAESIVLGDFDETLSQSDMDESVSMSIHILLSQGKIKAGSIPDVPPSDLLDMEWDGVSELKLLLQSTRLRVEAVLKLKEDQVQELAQLLELEGKLWGDDPRVLKTFQ